MQLPNTKRIKYLKERKISFLVELAFFTLAFLSLMFVIIWGDETLDFLKRKKLEQDIKFFKEAVFKYKYKEKYYPGDDPLAETKCPNSVYISNGDGSGFVGDSKYTDEEEQAIRHLICKKLLEGDNSKRVIEYPKNPFGGDIKLSYIKFNKVKINVIKVYKIPEKVAEDIDKSLDDGDLEKGNIIYLKEKNYKKEENLLVFKLFF